MYSLMNEESRTGWPLWTSVGTTPFGLDREVFRPQLVEREQIPT